MWQESKDETANDRLNNIKDLINTISKYDSLSEFLEQASLQMTDDNVDIDSDKSAIKIMTIHAAKGLEFDTVFLPAWEENIFPNEKSIRDGSLAEERRLAYVAITRAKEALYIHCNSNVFDYPVPNIAKCEDVNDYSQPQEITLQLTHRDVVLNFFKGKEKIIYKLRSGDALSISGSFLSAKMYGKDVQVVKFSKAFSEKLAKLNSKGYRPDKAYVNFVVFWKGEDDTEETLVLLPTLHLKR